MIAVKLMGASHLSSTSRFRTIQLSDTVLHQENNKKSSVTLGQKLHPISAEWYSGWKSPKNVSIELSTNFLVYKQLADKSKQTANKCKQIAETKVSLYQK